MKSDDLRDLFGDSEIKDLTGDVTFTEETTQKIRSVKKTVVRQAINYLFIGIGVLTAFGWFWYQFGGVGLKQQDLIALFGFMSAMLTLLFIGSATQRTNAKLKARSSPAVSEVRKKYLALVDTVDDNKYDFYTDNCDKYSQELFKRRVKAALKSTVISYDDYMAYYRGKSDIELAVYSRKEKDGSTFKLSRSQIEVLKYVNTFKLQQLSFENLLSEYSDNTSYELKTFMSNKERDIRFYGFLFCRVFFSILIFSIFTVDMITRFSWGALAVYVCQIVTYLYTCFSSYFNTYIEITDTDIARLEEKTRLITIITHMDNVESVK